MDAKLLDSLRRLDVRATFFVQGRWAEAYPRLARRIALDGHLVGSHSHYHARLPLLTDHGIAEDLRTAETVIRAAAGVDPRPWFRPPFGAGMDDPRVTRAIEGAGYRSVGWDVVGEDWDPGRTSAQVADAVVRGACRHGDGAVVLLHSWPDRMLGALPWIVDRLREAGMTFVRIDSLERIPALGSAVDELAANGPASAVAAHRDPT